MTTATIDRPHVVICTKPAAPEIGRLNDVHVVFSKYASRKLAELAAEQLKRVGCPCHVELAKPSDIAGMARRERAA
jgi:hypothetical protein